MLAVLAPRAALVAENLLLRQQVVVLRREVKRPRLRPFDRWLLATLVGNLRDLLATVLVVRPETLIRWHRAGWRLLWRWRSRRRRGRPPIDMDIRKLIRRMWRDNATWGENMICGEFGQAGVPRLAPNRGQVQAIRVGARSRPALVDVHQEPSSRDVGLRLLHDRDGQVPRALRLRRSLPPSAAVGPCRRHRAPDGGLVRSATG
jgi:hypothetical protein